MPFPEISLPELPLKIFLSVSAFFVVAAAFLLLAFLFSRMLRVRLDRRHTLRIENRGNCRSTYYLDVFSPEPGLRFALFAKGVPLVETRDEEEEWASAPVAQEEAIAADSPAPASPSKAAGSAPKPPAVNTSSALKTGQSAASKAGTMASFFGALAGLLPGSMGAGMRAQASKARGIQTGTQRAIQAPQAVQGQLGAAKKEGGKLVGAKPAPPRSGASKQAAAGQSKRTLNAAAGSGASAVSRTYAVSDAASYRVQSPELGPGQAIDLTLEIGSSASRYPAGSFAYTVESQQFAPDFPDVAAEPIRRSGVIYFKPVSAWRYRLPAFANVLLFLFSALSLVSFYLFLWQ
jgi:hypothetical protein